ncbi:MAG: hypothetical protein AABW88_01045 [Nanoarchaeota archaeon]
MKEEFDEGMIDLIDESFIDEEVLLEEEEINAIDEAFLRGYKAA